MKKSNETQPRSHESASNPNNNNTQSNNKKPSSALAAASRGESATENVKAKSTRDVNGSSGMRNTGTNVSYEDKE